MEGGREKKKSHLRSLLDIFKMLRKYIIIKFRGWVVIWRDNHLNSKYLEKAMGDCASNKGFLASKDTRDQMPRRRIHCSIDRVLELGLE
jgi:hypothetical protein